MGTLYSGAEKRKGAMIYSKSLFCQGMCLGRALYIGNKNLILFQYMITIIECKGLGNRGFNEIILQLLCSISSTVNRTLRPCTQSLNLLRSLIEVLLTSLW